MGIPPMAHYLCPMVTEQNTYGEKSIRSGEFDAPAIAKLESIKVASIFCMTVYGIPLAPFAACCCYPAMLRSAESRRVTLGEQSLFYNASRFFCCGPCQCKCDTSEQQVPLDKLQDIKLQQGCCARIFNIWSLSMETAGQGGSDGPEVQLLGLKDPREFKEDCLAQMKLAKAAGGVIASTALSEPPLSKDLGSAELVPILLRIEKLLQSKETQQPTDSSGSSM